MESSNRTTQAAGIFSDGGRAHKIHSDWHFWLWKMKWRYITAETLPEISSSVSRSSRNGHNLPQLVQDSEKPVVFCNWSAYFDEFFKKLPNIKKKPPFQNDGTSTRGCAC